MGLKTEFKIFSFILLILSACAPGTSKEYTEFHHLPAGGWCFGHPELFNPEQTDTVSTGSLAVTIRHNNAFPYANLALEIVSQGIDGSRVTDTVNITLADRYGNWRGSGSGAYIQMETPLHKKITHITDRAIELRHIMRTDTLRGLDIVGIKFIPD